MARQDCLEHEIAADIALDSVLSKADLRHTGHRIPVASESLAQLPVSCLVLCLLTGRNVDWRDPRMHTVQNRISSSDAQKHPQLTNHSVHTAYVSVLTRFEDLDAHSRGVSSDVHACLFVLGRTTGWFEMTAAPTCTDVLRCTIPDLMNICTDKIRTQSDVLSIASTRVSAAL